MKKMNLYWQGLINAALAGGYVSLVALFISFAPKVFGEQDGGILGFSVFLMTFVISAAIMGTLVLGKPAMLYMDGHKKDALKLFGITLGWMFIFVVVAVLLKIAI